MIDKWNKVNTLIKQAVQEKYPTAITGTDANNSQNPSQFPYVFVNQLGNIMRDNDLECGENAVNSTFEIQVYSTESILQARDIMSIVNDTLIPKGFTRIEVRQVENVLNPSIYRMVGRFRRVIANNDVI